jgi:membrane protein DedA with SNARE-associated domain
VTPHLLALASVTDSLVTLATHIIRDLGYAGIVVLMVSSAVIGVPGTEATMLFAGFNVYDHHLTMVGIIIFGVLGDLLGASIAFGIGKFGLHEVLDRPGSPVHVSKAKMERAHGWFEKWGAPVILLTRLVPLARSIFPYAAGTAEVSWAKFLPLTTLGSVIWVVGLGELGNGVGHNWPQWRKHLEIVDYLVVVLVVLAIVWLVVQRVRGGDRKTRV